MTTIEVSKSGGHTYGTTCSAVLAGPPGKGKTRFAVTAPDVYHLNAEAGMMSIAKKGVHSTDIVSIEQLLGLRKVLAGGPELYQDLLGVESIRTVVLDTFDEIARIMQSERLASERKETMAAADWSWLSDQLNALVRGFRSLPDMNVIFVCHVKDMSDDEGRVYYKLDLSGSIAHQLPGAVDLCLLLDDEWVREENSEGELESHRQQFVYTEPSPRYEWIKDRSGKLPAKIECDFVSGMSDILEQVFEGAADLPVYETRTVELDDDVTPAVSDSKANTTSRAASAPSMKDVKAQTLKAEAVIADAKAKKAGEIEQRSTVVAPVPLKDEPDITSAKHGERVLVELEEDSADEIPLGLQLSPKGTYLQVVGARWVYEVDGKKILSLNELPYGVTPVPADESNPGDMWEVAHESPPSNLFCQVTGLEVPVGLATAARVRIKKVLCEQEFEKALSK